MQKDPICGMEVNEKEAIKNNLVFERTGIKYYFCKNNCKETFTAQKFQDQNKSNDKVPWILGIILTIGAILAVMNDFMIIYMGIYFIIFSIVKMPDWKGFIETFSKYDIIAKRTRTYALLYPGIEFILGIIYLTFEVFYFNEVVIVVAAWITLLIMGIGSIGITKNLLSKNQVKCACLGTKIKIPLTKFTLVENIIMVIMATTIIFA